MNILVEQLPNTVDINGKQIKINSDFRSCLLIILAFEDNNLAPQEKQMVLFSNLYGFIPDDIEEAAKQAVKFLDGGKTREEDENAEAPLILYSFSKDAQFIFSAFKQTHGIDLDTSEMHWWKFLALFMDLGSETTFSNIIGLRKRLKTGKASKEERAAAREMSDVLDVPGFDDRTIEEKEAEDRFMKALERQKERNK